MLTSRSGFSFVTVFSSDFECRVILERVPVWDSAVPVNKNNVAKAIEVNRGINLMGRSLGTSERQGTGGFLNPYAVGGSYCPLRHAQLKSFVYYETTNKKEP